MWLHKAEQSEQPRILAENKENFHPVHCSQVNGHFMAQTDPLKLDQRPTPIELDPNLYAFTDKDLDRE